MGLTSQMMVSGPPLVNMFLRGMVPSLSCSDQLPGMQSVADRLGLERPTTFGGAPPPPQTKVTIM